MEGYCFESIRVLQWNCEIIMHFEQKPWNLCINICTLKLELKNKGQENTENMKLDRIMFWIWITNQYLKNGCPYEMILYCGNRSLFLNNSYMANVNVTEDPSTIFKFPLFFWGGRGLSEYLNCQYFCIQSAAYAIFPALTDPFP